MKSKGLFLLLFFFTINLICQTKFPNKYMPVREYVGQTIFDIVDLEEEKIDIGLWALIIAKEFDNSVDVDYYLEKLDEMALEIKRMLAGREKDMDKFLAAKMFIYDAGIWNQNHPFSYDLEDPLGDVLEHQLLSNYIDSRKGNCVSMPTLFLALMERVDPNVPFCGVTAPLHLFCRLRDRQTGDVWNVETANGGNPARNQWYIDEMNISQRSIESGLYLRDLSKKEYVACLLSPLIMKERKKGNFEKSMEYADLVLKIMPESVLGLVSKGALYAEIAYKKFRIKGNLTDEEENYYNSKSKKYIDKAFSLGWLPESKEQQENYLKSIKAVKNKN